MVNCPRDRQGISGPSFREQAVCNGVFTRHQRGPTICTCPLVLPTARDVRFLQITQQFHALLVPSGSSLRHSARLVNGLASWNSLLPLAVPPPGWCLRNQHQRPDSEPFLTENKYLPGVCNVLSRALGSEEAKSVRDLSAPKLGLKLVYSGRTYTENMSSEARSSSTRNCQAICCFSTVPCIHQEQPSQSTLMLNAEKGGYSTSLSHALDAGPPPVTVSEPLLPLDSPLDLVTICRGCILIYPVDA